MLLPNLIQTLSNHWQEVAAAAIRRIRQDENLTQLGSFPEADLRDRTRSILEDLGKLLIATEGEVAEYYQALGRRRFEEGVLLHELVRALQLIKVSMLEYGREQGVTGPLDLYAEAELELAADRMFDRMIYYVVRGYEQAFREIPAKFGSLKRKPSREPEFLGPSPF